MIIGMVRMPSLAQRYKDWRGPSRAELQAQISHLESNKFKRYNPVPSGVAISFNQFSIELNAELKGPGKWDLLERLALDPHVKGALRGITLPLTNAEWEIEPASDKPRDVEVAEFVSANLLRKGGDQYGPEFYLQTSWTQRLSEILQMLPHGYAMFAKSTKIVNGKRCYDRLQWLEPRSVDNRGWNIDDNDELVEVLRTYMAPGGAVKFIEPIPASQLLLYVWDMKGARFEGQPLTRSMFGAWKRKEFKQIQGTVLAQKLGSPVPYVWYPPGTPPSSIPALKIFAKSLTGTSPAESYIVGPQGSDGKSPDVGFAGAEHNIDRGFNESIQLENMEIAHAAGSTASNLGEGSSGSRALGDSKGLQEMILVEATAEIVAEFEAHGVGNLPGAIEELVDWNFADVKDYPRLVCNKVNQFAIAQAFAQAVEAWNAGIIPKNADARRQMVETFLGLNLNDDAYEIEEPLIPSLPDPLNPSQPDEGSPPVSGSTGDGENNTARELSLESAADFRTRIAPMLEPAEGAPTGGKFRGRNRLEAMVVDLAAVSHAFRVGETDVMTVLRATHRSMIDELMGRLRAGTITLRNIESQRRSAFKGKAKARSALRKVFKRSGAAGWTAVADEIERQQTGDVAA